MSTASSGTKSFAAQVCAGDRQALAEALNLLDDSRPEARVLAADLLGLVTATMDSTRGHIIGITGPPGVGKSSLSSALISEWRQRERTVAVLAVDPSSPISGGALLGDRLRMQSSTADDGIFIRSLSNRGEFGGLSAEVWPMSILMLAAFDIVLIETVGVGQREVDIARLCDSTCFIAQPGSGDSIQFLKAGILELPHILVVNKADMGEVARRTHHELQATLAREHPEGNWQVPVLSTSATQSTGIDELADTLERHRNTLLQASALQSRRREQQVHWLVKRLQTEFGDYGLARLGGDSAVCEALAEQAINPFQHYAVLRSRCISALTVND